MGLTEQLSTLIALSGLVCDGGGIWRVIQRTPKDVAIATDFELVAAQGVGLTILVLALYIRSALAVVSHIKSGPNTKISADYSLGINDDLVLPYNIHGWFKAVANEALVFRQSLAVASGVHVIWIPSI